MAINPFYSSADTYNQPGGVGAQAQGQAQGQGAAQAQGQYNFDPNDPSGGNAANQGYFTNEPGILARTLLRNMGMGGFNYSQNPLSNYFQNRALSSSVLGTFLNPSTNPQDVLGGAGAGWGNMQNYGGLMGGVRGLADVIRQIRSGQPVGGPTGVAANNLWANPGNAAGLVSSALGGLPAPLLQGLSGMLGTSSPYYAMYQDQFPGAGTGNAGAPSYLEWLTSLPEASRTPMQAAGLI